MLAKQKSTAQIGFYNTFEEQLNHSHPLYILANRIDWNVFEEAFKKHYSATQGKLGQAYQTNGIAVNFITPLA